MVQFHYQKISETAGDDNTAICRRAPLTQAACTVALHRHENVRHLEKTAWRLLATEVVQLAAESEACHDETTHVLPLWLATLDWVSGHLEHHIIHHLYLNSQISKAYSHNYRKPL